MEVSIIIPTHNEENLIVNCIKSLLNQSLKPKEIIVIDDASSDKTPELLKQFEEIKYFRLPENKGPSYSRNFGVEKSTSENILFCEADAVYDKDYIKYMMEPLKEEEIAGVMGGYRRALNKNLWTKLAEIELEARSISYNPLSGWAYKKKIFNDVGGFDEELRCGEDQDLGVRIKKAGYKIAYAPKAVIYHKEPETLKEIIKKSFWHGKNINEFYKKHKIFPKSRIFDILFPIAILLSFLNPYGFVSVLLLFLFYFIGKRDIIAFGFKKYPSYLFLFLFYLLVKRVFVFFGFISSLIKNLKV